MKETPFRSIDPTSGEVLGTFPLAGAAEIEQILGRADHAQGQWAQRSVRERADGVRSVAALLKARSGDLAKHAAREMGKPLAEGVAEAMKCALACEYYASQAEAFLAPRIVESDASRSAVHYEPLGVLLAIMPWNFPYWQAVRLASGALMAGNGLVIKHAPSVPQCALALEAVFRDADLPAGLVQNLFADIDQLPGILNDRRIAAGTLTGSTRAGRSFAAAAGQALKPVVLELGGNGAFVVLGDANLEEAAQVGVKSRTMNAGQTCISATRFIVVDSAYDRFVALLRENMGKLRLGNPMAETTDLGPMVSRAQRERLHQQVEAAVASGGRLLLGGAVPDGAGAYYPPTLIADVPPNAAAFREELFGPVAIVTRVKDTAAAVEAANDTVYGLSAAVWGGNAKELDGVAAQLRVGAVFVNGMVKSDPRLPFGGIKDSGFGRELGIEGVRSFTNAKSVWIR
ncbi:NAD-dependent succinate-semialdehyde dehydrogenase [Pendulispora rubella]|uniref:NAD-dependent succinate-semialdehyde dehydrogenase n=1 Tax=Pendulispora rubella TaxID=2741070 RepID=A0ABZ2L1L6_9BACT